MTKKRKTIPGQPRKTLTKSEIRRRKFTKKFPNLSDFGNVLKIGDHNFPIITCSTHSEYPELIDITPTGSKYRVMKSGLSRTNFELKIFNIPENQSFISSKVGTEIEFEIQLDVGIIKGFGHVSKFSLMKLREGELPRAIISIQFLRITP